MEPKQYEYLHRNKFISTHAKSFDEIIEALEGNAAFLKELKTTGKVEYIEGAEDDYARFITTDTEIAKKYDFTEVEDYDDEDLLEEDDFEDNDKDLADEKKDEDNIIKD